MKYNESKYISKEKTIEIENPRNVFLKGTNIFDGLNTYLGIWINGEYLVKVTIMRSNCVYYEYLQEEYVSPESTINKYLEYNQDITTISREDFEKQLDKLKTIINI